MRILPTGTVTFLFTDIEGSTTLLQRLGDRRYRKSRRSTGAYSGTCSQKGTVKRSTPKSS